MPRAAPLHPEAVARTVHGRPVSGSNNVDGAGDSNLPGSDNVSPKKTRWGRVRFKVLVARFFRRYIFTSLTKRIVFLNMAALVVLLSGILFLNQFRDSLIKARVESLLTQGQIISAAIAARATVDTDAIAIDPDKLLELQAGESAYPMDSDADSLDFPINPEQVAPILRRLISPTRTRARIYDRDGLIILDSDRLYSRGQILRYTLPPIEKRGKGFFERQWLSLRSWFWQSDLPLYDENADGNGTTYPEVVTALTGSPASQTSRTSNGATIVSVAVPVQRFRAVLGVLLLSTQAGDIDKILAKERWAIMRTFGVAAAVTLILSVLLASTIASPLRRLSEAANRVRLGVRARHEIPDFSERQDEIGHLSTALREMTDTLYARIEAIERFAADVSHELKNPLTSLRSAVETLPLARTDDQKQRLLDVIDHDVKRLDRLISDISDASRLDAELARDDLERIDFRELLEGYCQIYDGSKRGSHGSSKISVTINEGTAEGKDPNENWVISGHPGRLGQVLANLLDNARSFIPEKNGRIDLVLDHTPDERTLVLTVTDNGPGIPAGNTDKVFERFYTDRPGKEHFGQNSGLGLSITKQIIEAHGGTIIAENAPADEGGGARFTVRLPLVSKNGTGA